MSRAPTPAPIAAPAFAPAIAPIAAPNPDSDLFKQFMKAYLGTQPASSKAREEAADKPLKARSPDLYYGNSQVECYYFICQCKDYFETANAKGHKRVPFAAFFFRN